MDSCIASTASKLETRWWRPRWFKLLFQCMKIRLPGLIEPPPLSKIDDLRFRQDGIEIHRGFVAKSAVNELSYELDAAFARPILNRRRATSIWLADGLKVAALPTAFKAVNLLEVCVDIRALIPPEIGQNLIVTNLQVFADSHTENRYWHTDRRKGMVRAMLYLKGGGESSGNLLYMRGTHDLDHLVDHTLEEHEISLLDDRIVHCTGEPGDLVLFDSFGFHSKGNCVEDRVIAMFEFQPRDSDFKKASMDLNTRSLTPHVMEQIGLFSPGTREETYGVHGIDIYQNNDWSSVQLLRIVTADLLFLVRRMIVARARALLGPLVRRARRVRA
jgi:hypothetical protein